MARVAKGRANGSRRPARMDIIFVNTVLLAGDCPDDALPGCAGAGASCHQQQAGRSAKVPVVLTHTHTQLLSAPFIFLQDKASRSLASCYCSRTLQ